MYFEAELKGKNYKVDVVETFQHWKIGLQEEGQDWIFYNIPKSSYQTADASITFLFKGSSYLIDSVGNGTEYTVYTRGSYRTIKIYNDEMLLHESLKQGLGTNQDTELVAGIPGKIIKLSVKPGDKVKHNEPLLVMEAMKMENEMRAPRDLTIKEVLVSEGDSVEADAVLIQFD